MKSGTRIKLVQKIYEKTNNCDGQIDFGKDPYLRHIKKVFNGYFEFESDLDQILQNNLSSELSVKNLDMLLMKPRNNPIRENEINIPIKI